MAEHPQNRLRFLFAICAYQECVFILRMLFRQLAFNWSLQQNQELLGIALGALTALHAPTETYSDCHAAIKQFEQTRNPTGQHRHLLLGIKRLTHDTHQCRAILVPTGRRVVMSSHNIPFVSTLLIMEALDELS